MNKGFTITQLIAAGALGVLLGRFVYFKISKTAVVRRIQGSRKGFGS